MVTMRKIRNIRYGMALLTGLVLGLTACTDEIDIDLKGGDAPILVVDARLTTDSIRHTVLLSRSSDYYAPTSADLAVSGATVYYRRRTPLRFCRRTGGTGRLPQLRSLCGTDGRAL